ncbi:MAG TPA: hypothetical protein VN181_10095, partial [Thermoanaerobaculia bacterium]|nr:hypothetical protein [Thermoanaerobaculia bacterium]
GVVLEHLLVAPPSRFTRAETAALKRHAVASIRALGLRDLFCHVEMRYVDGEGPRVLEINPRIGGGCITESIETFTSLDVKAARVALILGEPPLPIRRRAAPRHAMLLLFSPRRGTLRLAGLPLVHELAGVRSVLAGFASGDRVGGDTEEIFVASVWMKAKDEAAAWRAYETVRDMVRISVT